MTHQDQGENLDEKLRLADKALLGAKQRGRNRTEVTAKSGEQLKVQENETSASSAASLDQRKVS